MGIGDNEKIKVSVMCATFNHESYIKDALEGFVSQKTDFAFEVLVNDDCSTDGTAAVIREYAEKYPGIIRPFYQEKNLFSQGMSIYDTVFYPNLRGEYIAFCEGDDYWTDPGKLAAQAAWLDAHPDCSACVHNTLVHHCGGGAEDAPLIEPAGDRDVDFSTILSGMSNCFHTSSLLVRRELIVNPPDFQRAAEAHRFSDYPIAIWAAVNGSVHFIDRCMSVYRVSSNSAAWSARVEGQYDRLKEFVTGEVEMFSLLLPHLSGERLEAAEKTLLERQYELLNIEGRVDEMVKSPFDAIYRKKSLSYKIKHTLKRAFPALHRLYRRRCGYPE